MVDIPTYNDPDNTRTVTAITQLAQGRTHATGTLAAVAGPNTVNFDYCTNDSVILLSPKDANAALSMSYAYVTSVGNQTFTVQIDAPGVGGNFGFVCLG